MEIAMKAIHNPKSLPWLARRAGVSDQVAERLWNKALTLAGPNNSEAAEPRRQAEAVQYLLRMLGLTGGAPGSAAGKTTQAYAALCQ